MKNQLRQQYKKIRQQLTATEIQQHSARIAETLLQTTFWQQSHTVMLYLSFQNEVATQTIYLQGWAEGKTMLLPICSTQDGHMEMSILSSFNQLVPNRYGIDELPSQLQQIIPPQQIDLCIIPGIAFDHAGNRLGFGAGYYDRYLPRVNPQAKRIALAYECQLHHGLLPTDAHDLPMNYIITEKQLYKISVDDKIQARIMQYENH